MAYVCENFVCDNSSMCKYGHVENCFSFINFDCPNCNCNFCSLKNDCSDFEPLLDK